MVQGLGFRVGLFPLAVTVTTRGIRSYNSPLIRPPLKTVTGWGNDPRFWDCFAQVDLKPEFLAVEAPRRIQGDGVLPPPERRSSPSPLCLGFIWGIVKNRGTFLGVPIIRIIVYLGLYWGPLCWETTI